MHILVNIGIIQGLGLLVDAFISYILSNICHLQDKVKFKDIVMAQNAQRMENNVHPQQEDQYASTTWQVVNKMYPLFKSIFGT